ncbi:MAG: hypothetical protein AAF974_01800 [Cyanobacteria bacterium P01_E01_bin.34]
MMFGIAHQAGDRPVYPRPLPSNKFANLWHRWDFIEAKSLTNSGHPEWQRVKTFPLEPRPLMRRWGNSDLLVGVSFGKQTRYCMVDIDAGSQYHPDRYPSAYRQVLDQLEDIGLVEPLILTSSESGGLHLYYPLPISVSSYKLGHLLKRICEQGGLAVRAGQLELFPNARRFSLSSIVLYQAHRLPLQQGSYLLDKDGNAIGNDLKQFMFRWKRAASRQDSELLSESLQNLPKVIQCPYQRRSERAKTFEADERARIKPGWTCAGQTNSLLGAIARYGRVWEGLADEELASYIESVAVELPGYQDHCHHKDEIGKRSLEWARSSTKHYYPYSERAGKVDKPKHPTNEERQQAACERIKQAMKALIEVGKLALGITSRCQQLSGHGVSKETLYKNKELWHPEHYQEEPSVESEIPLSQALAETPLPSPSESQSPYPSQAPTFKITNPPQRSLGQSEPVSWLKDKKEEQTIGGCRGDVSKTAQSNLPSAENIGALLARVKGAAGKYWSSTLRQLVEVAEPQRVLSALDVYLHQCKRVKISNPGAWLYRAIVEGYELSADASNSATCLEFNEWFASARRANLAVASEHTADGEIWVYLADGRKALWSDVRWQPLTEEHASDERPVSMPDSIRLWISRQNFKGRDAMT